VTSTQSQETRDQASSGPAASSKGRWSQRPLGVIGAVAACAAAGAGLATLTLVAALGWIAAPHASVGSGLTGVLRTAIQLWLVGHHVGFALRGAGPFGLLPLGLVLLPGALLWRSGRWVVRTGRVRRLRHVGYAALALALPYGLLTGSLGVASRTALSAPSPVQAAGAGFVLALGFGGLGGLRALAPWGRLIALLPDRARCLVAGVTGSLAVLTASGALLAGVSLAIHASEFRLISDELSPGPVGAILLLLASLAYAPNAIIWAIAYMLGPGFAVGAGTVVAPTGSVIGPLPMFPMLAALPSAPPGTHAGGPGPASLAMLAAPYLAGAFGGLLTVRTAPSPTVEGAPLWGLACGALSGCLLGALAWLSGGPLGSGRMATIGPSGWEIVLVAALELGVSAAITAGLVNWLLIRRRRIKLIPATAPPPAETTSYATGFASHLGRLTSQDDDTGHQIYMDPWAHPEDEPAPSPIASDQPWLTVADPPRPPGPDEPDHAP
jgi:hypothetical protein